MALRKYYQAWCFEYWPQAQLHWSKLGCSTWSNSFEKAKLFGSQSRDHTRSSYATTFLALHHSKFTTSKCTQKHFYSIKHDDRQLQSIFFLAYVLPVSLPYMRLRPFCIQSWRGVVGIEMCSQVGTLSGISTRSWFFTRSDPLMHGYPTLK